MENYRKIELVGRGNFGSAVLVQSTTNRKYYIMKMIDIMRLDRKKRQDALNEVVVLKELSHPYIIAYRESFVDKERFLCIVMDYCERGDLYNQIIEQRKKGQGFSEQQIMDWFVQICFGLKFIHDRRILHRDLKTQNIFLTKNRDIKIGDFGIAKVLQNTCEMAKTAIGTPYYLSPEICQAAFFMNWRLFVTPLMPNVSRFIFFQNNLIVAKKDPQGLVLKILRGNYPAIPNCYSSNLNELIGELLQKQPSMRPSIKRILEKPYLQETIDRLLSNSLNSLSKPDSGNKEKKDTCFSLQKDIETAVQQPIERPLTTHSQKHPQQQQQQQNNIQIIKQEEHKEEKIEQNVIISKISCKSARDSSVEDRHSKRRDASPRPSYDIFTIEKQKNQNIKPNSVQIIPNLNQFIKLSAEKVLSSNKTNSRTISPFSLMLKSDLPPNVEQQQQQQQQQQNVKSPLREGKSHRLERQSSKTRLDNLNLLNYKSDLKNNLQKNYRSHSQNNISSSQPSSLVLPANQKNIKQEIDFQNNQRPLNRIDLNHFKSLQKDVIPSVKCPTGQKLINQSSNKAINSIPGVGNNNTKRNDSPCQIISNKYQCNSNQIDNNDHDDDDDDTLEEPEDERVKCEQCIQIYFVIRFIFKKFLRFLCLEGNAIPGISESDSIFNRIEALRVYLEKNIGEDIFLQVYSILTVIHIILQYLITYNSISLLNCRQMTFQRLAHSNQSITF